MTFERQDMRYGENPQGRRFTAKSDADLRALACAEQLWGKELSFNNINDAGALDTLAEFGDELACAVAVKHANPCGVAVAPTLYEAYKRRTTPTRSPLRRHCGGKPSG